MKYTESTLSSWTSPLSQNEEERVENTIRMIKSAVFIYVFCNYVDGMTGADYGHWDGSIEYEDYKSYIVEALRAKFGYGTVSIGNKCVNIKANSYHVNADVVPAFQYRDYKAINSVDATRYIEGIKYIAEDGAVVINLNYSWQYKYAYNLP